MKKFKFIDLFSGVGGFHQAMCQIGGECVFASEIDKFCTETYMENYGINSQYDITDVRVEDIPKHDVLCAGFPCQAFSKAGKQSGMDDARGTLFFEIARILKYHKTKYIILENVRNLVTHDKGNTKKIIYNTLKELGYRLTSEPLILSPHHFGIPQLRERVVIVGLYDPANVNLPLEINFEKLKVKNDNSIYTIVNSDHVDAKYNISEHEKMVLNAWDEFYKGINQKVIGFPIWSDYFRNTTIPSKYPEWKKDFVRKNMQLYKDNKKFIDSWLLKYNNLEKFNNTQRKMEWQAAETIKTIWEGVIQFRPSGIRVKAPTCFPALVAIVQIPIIGKYKRRLTVEEAAALQSFSKDFKINSNLQQAYKQLGNSVNVVVIREVAEKLIKNY